MSAAEIAVWSGCVGVFAVSWAIAVVNSAVTRSVAGAQAAGFILMAGLFVWCSSGLLETFALGLSGPTTAALKLLSGPAAATVATLGLIVFLRTHQRDAVVQYGLRVVCGLAALGLLGFLWPNPKEALEGVALLIIACAVLSFWLVLRAALLGDRFAWPMVAAALAMLVAVLVLYAAALGIVRGNLPIQMVGSAAAASYIIGSAVALWRRNTEYLRMRRALSLHREKDLLTQLWTGVALAQRVDQTIARARRNRKETAIICIEIFNVAQLRQELGHNAIEQVIYSIAARVRQCAGASTEVGRYDDTSFVVIVDGVKHPSMLRTLGLRLAVMVRKPYMLNPQSTSPREFRADMGVGIARLPASRDVKTGRRGQSKGADTTLHFDSMSMAQEAMHEASVLSKTSRKFASRTAIIDAYSRKTVPVDEADLR